jgi:hypothetical protein
VSAILAEMHRDPIRTRTLGGQGKRHRIGLDRATARRVRVAIARLTQRCAVIDIDAEKNRARNGGEQRGHCGYS